MTTLFVSDLHLDPTRPEATDQFLAFLATQAAEAEALYILGDLFEAWIGDDDPEPEKHRVLAAIRTLTDGGQTCYFMRGNRDFLVGEEFSRETGCKLLEDPTIVDLYGEVASHILAGKVKDLDVVTSTANTRGNPNEYNITRLFNSIGFPDILDGISWQRMSNKQLRAKLKAFNKLRNKIVHGSSEAVRKSNLTNYLAVLTTFGEKFDDKLRREVRGVTGAFPW